MLQKTKAVTCRFFSKATGLHRTNVGMLQSGDEFMSEDYDNAVGIVFASLGCVCVFICLCDLYETLYTK